LSLLAGESAAVRPHNRGLSFAATMTPRRLPLDSETLRLRQPALLVARPAAAPGWTRKTLALAMHLACLALFWWTVVAPVASPIARGELAREFKPLREAWVAWVARLSPGR
jgi:hypothetical protein